MIKKSIKGKFPNFRYNKAMKYLVLLLFALISMALAFDPLPPMPSTTGVEAAETAILESTNQQRAKLGLVPLKLDLRLRAAARLHALDMATRNYFSHNSNKTGFETPSKRVNQAGILELGIGENIAFNEVPSVESASKLMVQWMNSPPHRAAILNPEFTHIGVGVYRRADGRTYGVQDFAIRNLEVIADTTRAVLNIQQFKLEGRVDLGLQIALFADKQYLGIIPTTISGRFLRVLDYEPNKFYQLGWRKNGSSEAFLVQATTTLPSTFQAGAAKINLQRDAPYTVSGTLEARQQDSFTLTLQFPNASKNVLLLERIGSTEERTIAKNNSIQTRCAVGAPRRPMQIGYGNNSFTFTHRFVMDCKTGMLDPGAEK